MANTLLTGVHRFKVGRRPELEEALDLAMQAVALQPDLDAAAKALAFAHHQLGEWIHDHVDEEPDRKAAEASSMAHREKAREGYERALRLNPRHFVAANNLANLQFEWAKACADARQREELLAAAGRAAEKSLQISPGFHFAHDNLGNIRLERGEHLEALLAFQSALRFNPNYPEAHNDQAIVYLDARYGGADAPRACRHHLTALSLTAVNADGQRLKLCRQFMDRVRILQNAHHLVEGLILPSEEPNCSCSRLSQKHA
jgi:tetratricopeptide (TPR) repeat protein